MSMNVTVQLEDPKHPNHRAIDVTLAQTSTDESWRIIGQAHDFSDHHGIEPYFTRYAEVFRARVKPDDRAYHAKLVESNDGFDDTPTDFDAYVAEEMAWAEDQLNDLRRRLTEAEGRGLRVCWSVI